MFQFRRFPTYAYLIQRTPLEYCSSRFPHSEIPGSMDICSSPRLIAACHVLRRLLMPRHSPCALYSLTYRIFADPLVELCRLSRDFFGLIVFTLHPFGCVPQLKHTFPDLSIQTSLLPYIVTSFSCSVFKVRFSLTFCFKIRNKLLIS